jgi:hypothetical protein
MREALSKQRSIPGQKPAGQRLNFWQPFRINLKAPALPWPDFIRMFQYFACQWSH